MSSDFQDGLEAQSPGVPLLGSVVNELLPS